MKTEAKLIGIEVMEGVSKKSGKTYSMGRLHVLTKLAAPQGEDNVSKGFMGDVYECDAAHVRAVAHLPYPVDVVLDLETEMRFGERRMVCTGVKPLGTVKVAA